MKLYNSATRKKEDFVPNNPDIVKMYTCGPTVYHYAHIGNLRSYIMEDVLEKFLRSAGYDSWLSVEFEGMESTLNAITIGAENLRRYIG